MREYIWLPDAEIAPTFAAHVPVDRPLAVVDGVNTPTPVPYWVHVDHLQRPIKMTDAARLLHPHFVKEEEYALPPLGLLVPLSEGKFEAGMAGVLKMTDRLKPELSTMLAEHKEIVGALAKLVDAAKAENKPAIAHFAEKLMLHAQTEEQVLYPAAILVGEIVRSKLAK